MGGVRFLPSFPRRTGLNDIKRRGLLSLFSREEVINAFSLLSSSRTHSVPWKEQEKRLLLRGETSGRSDDNLESARKRFKTYLTETMPVVEHFEKQGKLRRVAAELSPDAVYELTRAAVIDLIE